MQFENKRAALNEEIARITARKSAKDNVDIYKYFLETRAEEMSDRIHYFTSFYYMLIELSFLSSLGAYVIVFGCIYQMAKDVSPTSDRLGIDAVLFVIVVQLVVLFPLNSVRTLRTRIVLFCLPVATIAALLIPTLATYNAGVLSFNGLLSAVGITPFALLVLSYLFWRLGDKHWKQIIDEQIVLVNAKGNELTEVAKTYISAGTGTDTPLRHGASNVN